MNYKYLLLNESTKKRQSQLEALRAINYKINKMMREGWEIHCPIEFVPYYDVLKGSNNILLDNSGEYCATMRIKYYKYPKVISI